jgi:shikimate dehydrogenase
MITHPLPIDGKTNLAGIFGYPVAHSLSPAMHNAAFAALGLNWVFLPLSVAPPDLPDALRGFRALGFRGASVTVPHKQTVMPLLDEITEEARAMGAVNAIIRWNDWLIGDNTDWRGFLIPLGEVGFDPSGQHCAVLGAGGAARAVVYALARSGAAMVTVLNRTVPRATALVRDLQTLFPTVALRARSLGALGELISDTSPAYRLVVNATSVGMWPETDRCPWPESIPIPGGAIVYDLVYYPLHTRLIQRAAEAGCRTITGLGMLVYQGATAFKMWTGREPPVEVMYDTVRELLCSDS